MALDPKYMISPNLQEIFIDPATGLPMVGGYVYYYSDNMRSNLKTVYELSGTFGSYSFIPLTNPIQLNGSGSPVNGSGADVRVYYHPYDAQGNIENYYIRVTDLAGNTKITRQAWPNLAGASTDIIFAYNFIRNSNFYSWSNGIIFNNVLLGSINDNDFMVDDWTYTNDDPAQTISISQGTFIAGQATPPNNPTFYLNYQNTSGGVSQSINKFTQSYQGVQTLNGQNVSISIWMKQVSGANGNISVDLTQYFGAGGSPSVVTPIILSNTLTIGNYIQFSGSAQLPTITGFTIGTGNKLYLNINMPLNLQCQVQISNVILNQGASIISNQEISNDDMQKQTNTYGLYPAFTTGDIKLTLKNSAEIGWLIMDDSTIGNPSSTATHKGWSYNALFDLLWNNVSDTYAPVVGGRGMSAQADWDNAMKITLTKTLGRVLGGIGNNGVNTYTLGENAGSDSTNQVVSHTHAVTGTVTSPAIYLEQVGGGMINVYGNDVTVTPETFNVTGTASPPSGSVSAMSIVQASAYYNVMIKL